MGIRKGPFPVDSGIQRLGCPLGHFHYPITVLPVVAVPRHGAEHSRMLLHEDVPIVQLQAVLFCYHVLARAAQVANALMPGLIR